MNLLTHTHVILSFVILSVSFHAAAKSPLLNRKGTKLGYSTGNEDEELETLTEKLLSLDTVNNATEYIRVNLQGLIAGISKDYAPNPLLTVGPKAFERSTIKKLLALHDNYIPEVNAKETYSNFEESEITAFIDEIFNTPVMQALQQFLVSKDLASGKRKFREMWFGLYSRGNGVLSSCGFEHVFIGELKSGVSGFHNWVHFAKQEANQAVNYLGYKKYLDMGAKGSLLDFSFKWRNQLKQISTMFIGTSPEFELAIYTVCFLTRPNSRCKISLDRLKLSIQTFASGSDGQYVATAYPEFSKSERGQTRRKHKMFRALNPSKS